MSKPTVVGALSWVGAAVPRPSPSLTRKAVEATSSGAYRNNNNTSPLCAYKIGATPGPLRSIGRAPGIDTVVMVKKIACDAAGNGWKSASNRTRS